MKAFKLEILVIDFDNLGEQRIKETIENTNYPNDCICPKVKSIEGREIGEWNDNHPLNKRATAQAEYQRLFGVPAMG